jgi:hypothetical protein
MAQDPQTQAVSNAPVNVQQVNIGGDNALEAVRRLAFAIAKAQHTQSLLPQAAPSGSGANGTIWPAMMSAELPEGWA